MEAAVLLGQTPIVENSSQLWAILHGGSTSLMWLYLTGLAGYVLLHLMAAGRWWWLALLDNFIPWYFIPLLLVIPLGQLVNNPAIATAGFALLLIGAGWFGARWLPKPTQPGAASLRVITFNLYPYNQRLHDVASWLIQEDADLVLLQEAPAHIGTAFDALYDHYPYHAIQDHENGYLIFSRYPITQTPDSFFTDPSGWYLHQRVELDVNGQPLVVYNIHTLMPNRETPQINLPLIPDFILKYDEALRDGQIRLLAESAQQETHPVILAGDFNMSEFSAAYKRLRQDWQDAYQQAGVGMGFSWPSGASEEMPDFLPAIVRLDYVWHSSSLRATAAHVGAKLGSDHLPLIVTLAWDT